MSKKMIDAIAAGHVCLDLTPKIDVHGKTVQEVLRPGKLVHTGECFISLGGPVSNTGIALGILGQDVALMCKVGNDMFGRIISEKSPNTEPIKSLQQTKRLNLLTLLQLLFPVMTEFSYTIPAQTTVSALMTLIILRLKTAVFSTLVIRHR